jgi:hypothetical protein
MLKPYQNLRKSPAQKYRRQEAEGRKQELTLIAGASTQDCGDASLKSPTPAACF